MDKALKDKLVAIAVVIVVIAGAIWMFLHPAEHIEDTNGPDDYSLVTITEEDITSLKITGTGIGQSTNSLQKSTVKFSSKKFSGVDVIMSTNFIMNSGNPFDVIDLKVKEGNFRMVVVCEGKIVAEYTPEGEIIDLGLENLKGYTSLVIAGESANFSFRLWKDEFEGYGGIYN